MGNIRRWRKMTWVLWVWCLVIIIWAVSAGASAADTCSAEEEFRDACEAGAAVGGSLAVGAILLIGFFGFVFFGFIWFMTRPKRRTCQRCGEDVRKGFTECPSCGQPMGDMATATHA